MLDLLLTGVMSLFVLLGMANLARQFGLVDRPSDRKLHPNEIPLVGGISICITMANFIYFNTQLLDSAIVFIGCITALTLLGALDDRFGLSVRFRLLVQIAITLIMVYLADIQVVYFGDLLGFGDIYLGRSGVLITVLASVACMNAFNMIDGIDGLLGGLSVIAFAGIALLLSSTGDSQASFLCVVFIIAMIPYIALNLGVSGNTHKVFMGDAGSAMIGFAIVWLLLAATQNSDPTSIRPVTALWLAAVPLIDLTAVVCNRLVMKMSPFKADRNHLHHICLRLGLSSRQTLICICIFSVVLALFGIVGEIYQIPEYVMFYSFIALFLLYLTAISNFSFIQRLLKKK
jgi:UDP-GlcNAc:undecaprenyl-phosphate GlcNAc-1-phosphate transferase